MLSKRLDLPVPNLLRLTAKGTLVLTTTLTDLSDADRFFDPSVELRDDLDPDFDQDHRWGSTTALRSVSIRITRLRTEQAPRTISDWLQLTDLDPGLFPTESEAVYDVWEFLGTMHPNYVQVAPGQDVEQAVEASQQSPRIHLIEPTLRALEEAGLFMKEEKTFTVEFERPGGMVHVRVPELQTMFQWKMMVLPNEETDEAIARVLGPFEDLHDLPEFSLRLEGLVLEKYP